MKDTNINKLYEKNAILFQNWIGQFLSDGTGFVNAGYDFKGWALKEDGATYKTAGATVSGADLIKDAIEAGATNSYDTQSITLYAVWGVNTYSITYSYNGQTKVDSGEYNDTLTIRDASTFSKAGYHFTEWTDGTNEYACGSTYTIPAKDITVEPVWVANTYTIKYAAGVSNKGVAATGTAPADQTATYDAAITLRENTFVLAGYTFAGWKLVETYGNASNNGAVEVINLAESGEVTLVAQWTPIEYAVEFAGEGTLPTAKSYANIQILCIFYDKMLNG